MIEVKVPSDIDSYRTPVWKGFSGKYLAYFGVMAAIIIPMSIWGGNIIHPELVGWVNLLVAVVILSPLVLEKDMKNGITGEEALVNMVLFFFQGQKRHYEYMDCVAEWDESLNKNNIGKGGGRRNGQKSAQSKKARQLTTGKVGSKSSGGSGGGGNSQ